MRNESYLSHEEQLSLLHEEAKREIDDQNLLVRYYALPEINIATNDGYNELKQMREEVRASRQGRSLSQRKKQGSEY